MDDPPNNRSFWESEAQNWIAWARTPNHDDYWNYAPRFFNDIVPQEPGSILEIGCGEGRVTRDLRARGHDVISIDGAPSLVRAASEADQGHRTYVLGDAARLPFTDAGFSCVVATTRSWTWTTCPGPFARLHGFFAQTVRCASVSHTRWRMLGGSRAENQTLGS